MKKFSKIFLIAFSIIVIISGSFTVIFAHPGKTDSSGGHYDRSTGEYHYHHGYAAHQHENGTCPYDFDNNEKSNYNSNNNDKDGSSIDYDSLIEKAKIKDSVNEYLNNYERLNNYYELARKQLSDTGTINRSLYTDFYNLNETVVNSLQDYKEYLDDDTYDEIEKETTIYSEFLENNIPDEETQSSLDSDVIIKSFCYFVLGLYIIEIIVCVIIFIVCKKKNIQTFLSDADLFITGIIYLIISAIYFAPIFSDSEKQWWLLFLYIPAPIVSTYVLSILCNNVKNKMPINDIKNATSESTKSSTLNDNKTHFVKYTNAKVELSSETKSKIKEKATELYNISNSIKCEHSRLSNILSQYLLITNSNLTPIEYFNIKNQIENLKNIFPKEYYSFVLQYENLKDLANIDNDCVIFNDICYQKSDSKFKKRNNIPKEYQELKEIIKNNNIKLKINDNNNILDKNSSFYTNLDKVTRYSIFLNRTRQSILSTIDINTDFFSIEPYADFPIHLEPYVNRDGKDVFLAILTRTDEDLGEINIKKSELLYNNSDHNITAKIIKITGGEPPKTYYGCNIKVTID